MQEKTKQKIGKWAEPAGVMQPGSGFKNISLMRPMKVYPVQESEVQSLGLLNQLVTGFFSASSGFAFFALGLWAQAESGDKQPTSTFWLLFWVCVFVALIFLVIGGLCVRQRKSVWQKIQDEAKEIQTRSETSTS